MTSETTISGGTYKVECGACRITYEQGLRRGEQVVCCGACGWRAPRPTSTMITRPRCDLRVREVAP